MAALLDPAALIARVEQGFADLAAGRLTDRRSTRIDSEEHAANYATFPAYWPRLGLAAVKVLSGVATNPARGRPVIDAVVVVLDAATGVVRAIMDGRRITALRTAAASAVAVKHLAPGDGGILALVGTGAQAVAHAETLNRVRSFDRLLIASASGRRDRAEVVAGHIRQLTGTAVAAVDAGDAVRSADVVVLATVSKTPLAMTGDVGRNAMLVSVGLFQPGATEFDPAIAEAAELVVADDADRLRSTWQPTGARFGERAIDLAGLVSGSAQPATIGLRVFLSDGRAFEDLAAAALVLEAAERSGFSGQPLLGTLPVPALAERLSTAPAKG